MKKIKPWVLGWVALFVIIAFFMVLLAKFTDWWRAVTNH